MMESPARVHHRHRPLQLPFHHHGSSLISRPISSVWFKALPPSILLSSSSASMFSSIRATSLSSESFLEPVSQTSRPQLLQNLSPVASAFVKTTCITLAAAAIFFMRVHQKPALAVPFATDTVENTENVPSEEELGKFEEKDPAGVPDAPETDKAKENVPSGEEERKIEEQFSKDPTDTEAIRSLLEVKIQAGKLDEAIGVLDRVIEVDPNESEWSVLKAHMCMQNGKSEMAKEVFEGILKTEPYRVEAYHGLVMATYDAKESFQDLLKRIDEAMEVCNKQNKTSDVRDFKLLLAQIKVMEGDYTDALKAYQELAQEEPTDFRPYLCQGIIYTILRKRSQAEAQFEKFRSLVPKNHPYKEYFEGNMLATKLFAHKLEKVMAGSMS